MTREEDVYKVGPIVKGRKVKFPLIFNLWYWKSISLGSCKTKGISSKAVNSIK